MDQQTQTKISNSEYDTLIDNSLKNWQIFSNMSSLERAVLSVTCSAHRTAAFSRPESLSDAI